MSDNGNGSGKPSASKSDTGQTIDIHGPIALTTCRSLWITSALGRKGWELVSISNGLGHNTAMFKRKIKTQKGRR